MPTGDELEAWLSAVRTCRYTGTLTVVFPDKSTVTYKSDAELAAAEASLERQLANLSGNAVHTVLVQASKGLE